MNQTDRPLIEASALFRHVGLESVEGVLDLCATRDLAVGETLLEPDLPNDKLYLILAGELRVYVGGRDLPEHAILGAGECVGELSLIDGRHASALVIAARPTRLLAISHDHVWTLINHSHEAAINLLGILAGRMRLNNLALVTSQSKTLEFEQAASVDALTGVHNRRWMMDAFARTLRRSILDNTPMALVMADIDHFKRVNDEHGHLIGDGVLKAVARIFAEHLRPQDLLARYGGEEFAVLLPATDIAEAADIAERLREAVAERHLRHEETVLSVTVSFGIASRQPGDDGIESLVRRADQALYRAKNQGRNRVEIARDGI